MMEKKRVKITLIREYTNGKITRKETTVQRWTEDDESISRVPSLPFKVGMTHEPIKSE